MYAARKDKTEKFNFIHPKAKPILESTYGILVYQEQVMQLSRILANFTMGESDVLRKAIGKKKIDLMMQMEEKFKSGCVKFSNMNILIVNELWDNIVKFASYSFNKSHAAAYALIAYRTAYLKKHYELYFMTAVISANTKSPEKMSYYLESTKQMGIKILTPEINKSNKEFTVENKLDTRCIRFGLSGIKNVGEEAIQEIIRKRPYESYQDFINKVDLSKINKRVLRSLISVGCFNHFSYNRTQLLAIYETVKKSDNNKIKQMTLFGTIANKVIYPDLPEPKLSVLLEMELEYLGVYASAHPLDLYNLPKNQTILSFDTFKPDMDVKVYGLIKKYNSIITKNGDTMAFLTVANKSSSCEVVVFPNEYQSYFRGKREDIIENTCVIIDGTCKTSNKGENIIANHIRFPPRLL